MVGWICMGMLAAFGLVSAVWCLLGWLLPFGSGAMVCASEEQAFIRRYHWLHGLGLVRCPLVILERTQPGTEEWCREVLSRFGTGEKDVDGTGTGDPAGRDQRRGISEL